MRSYAHETWHPFYHTANQCTARFYLIDPNVRLIYAFDMHVGGKLFSVSLAGEYETES
jgi:hypothetical protein